MIHSSGLCNVCVGSAAFLTVDFLNGWLVKKCWSLRIVILNRMIQALLDLDAYLVVLFPHCFLNLFSHLLVSGCNLLALTRVTLITIPLAEGFSNFSAFLKQHIIHSFIL